MPASFDLDALLNQPLFGWDTLSLLGDVEDFLDFSEANIDWQRKREIRRVEAENATFDAGDPLTDAQYRDQQLESVEYRFNVSLTQRVRYSGLTSLIISLEWSLLVLRNLAIFEIPKKPDKTNASVHLLSVLAREANRNLQAEIELLALLVQVRNCVVHSAGQIGSYEYGEELRTSLTSFQGIRISTANFLGEGIEIEQGFLQEVLEKAKVWLPALEKTLYEQGSLRK
jgi:hypothetical protein